MGKPEQPVEAPAVNNEDGGGSASCCNASAICRRSVLKWIIVVVLSVDLLMFAILEFPIFGKGNRQARSSENEGAQIKASFRLRKPISAVNESLMILESDIWMEIGVPSTRVTILSLEPLASANGKQWTQVVFGVIPDPENALISAVGLSVLRRSLLTLTMLQSDLHLTRDLFGKAYYFQVLKFPGGLTVVPEQSGYPLYVQVLFNFTLHYSVVRVVQNLDQLKDQLKSGLHVQSTENLFVQLTNLNGSTVDPPIIVETSVMPVVGNDLPIPRLKQLAREITGSPARNLGLNHTLFGKVKQIQLSTFLQHSLCPPPSHAPSPAPSPSHPIRPSPLPASPLHPSPSPHHHRHHHHHHRHHHHRHHFHHHNHHRQDDIAPSPQHYAVAPSQHHELGPSHHCDLVHCHHCHAYAPNKCGHQHVRHAPVSALSGTPPPLPSHTRSPQNWHHTRYHGAVVPTPHVAHSPYTSPCSKAHPCHGQLPPSISFSTPSPASSGTPLPSSPPSILPSHAPCNDGITTSSPYAAAPPFTSWGSPPKSSLTSPIILTHVRPPEQSMPPHAEASKEGSPVPAFSPISSSSCGVRPPLQIVIWAVILVGTLIISLLP